MHPSLRYRSSPADFPPVAASDSRRSDVTIGTETPPTAEIHDADVVVGLLIAEADARAQRSIYRFKALDARFRLLDDSRFFGMQKATTAVARISRLATLPVPANEA